jgi:hypothetical protein
MVENWMTKIHGDHLCSSTFHTTLKVTLGQLVFGRDMVLPINFMADWGAIEQQRKKEIARNNRRENAS